ncbi:MAG: ATP-dependent helicase C-terminal domain-containing protein, partial [Planctomycetota bacterium]
DVGAREELLRRVEAGGFRSARHEGVEASIAACREAASTARDLVGAAQGGDGAVAADGATEFEGDSFARVSRAMLAGFGDHVGWRMDAQRPHCAMPGRRKVSIDPASIQRGAGFVLALEVREGGRGDSLHQSLGMVTPLEPAWVEHAMPARFSTCTEVRFDERLGAPAEFEERAFDGIVFEQVVRPLRGREAREAAHEELAARIASGDLRPASWDEGVEASIAACREAVSTARDLMRAAQGGDGADAAHGATDFEGDSFARVSRAMLSGFGDHVGWRMDAQRPHCAMPGRRKVSIDPASIQRGAGFVLALEVREGGHGDSLHQSLGMVTPLEAAWVEHAMPARFATRTEVRFDERLGAPAEFAERAFDGIVFEQVVRPLRGREAREAAHEELAARIASGDLRPASWDEGVEQWIARVRCVAAWFPDRGLIRYDADDLGVLAAEIAQGCARASDLDARPVLDILRNALSWDEQQFVERMAPSGIALPKGWRMKLEYAEGKPPRGRAKIQDFYDFAGHPSVAGGRVRVVLELLGPNLRPVQVTEDLPGFWERLYPEVKKELKRRYPRHEWR